MASNVRKKKPPRAVPSAMTLMSTLLGLDASALDGGEDIADDGDADKAEGDEVIDEMTVDKLGSARVSLSLKHTPDVHVYPNGQHLLPQPGKALVDVECIWLLGKRVALY